jgi:hypothetical protein
MEVGLDPDLLRDFGRAVQGFKGVAARCATGAGPVFASALLVDPGVVALCRELQQELGLLENLAFYKADQMEAAANGLGVSRPSSLRLEKTENDLLTSLADGVGSGIDFKSDAGLERANGVVVSGSVAANVMAEYLRLRNKSVTGEDLDAIVNDESAPAEVRAAAQFFLDNYRLTNALYDNAQKATAQMFSDFAQENKALAVVATMFDRLETAKQGAGGKIDGHVSYDDFKAVLTDTTGRFSAEEKAAVQFLIRTPEQSPNWSNRKELTTLLVERQVFAENPTFAALYSKKMLADPKAYIDPNMWRDMRGVTSMNTAVMGPLSTLDRSNYALKVAGAREATSPEKQDAQLSSFIHGMLDVISLVDPTQITDGLNAALYLLEGDYKNALFCVAGMLLVVGGGAVLKAGEKGIAKLGEKKAAKELEKAGEKLVLESFVSGALTPSHFKQVIAQARKNLGDDVANAFQKEVDDLAEQAAKHTDNVADDLAVDTAKQVDKIKAPPTTIAVGPSVTNPGSVGFDAGAVESAYQGMRKDGGHAMRHLIQEGLIPNSGSFAKRLEQFKELTSPILARPVKTFDWKLGATSARAMVGEVDGKSVVVFVAKEGPFQGRILSALVPDEVQIIQWGL